MRCLFLLFLLLQMGCSSQKNLITKALNSNAPEIRKVVKNIDDYELQIKLSEIIHIGDSIVFYDHDFQVNDSVYFYPASTVKFPITVLALEKLFAENKKNANEYYDIDTPFLVEGDSVASTFRKDIVDIFTVSSNQAYNRLFEYLGTDYINQNLKLRGVTPSQISHRLSTQDATNLKTKEITFFGGDSLMITIPSTLNTPIEPLGLDNMKRGQAYYAGGELIQEPMDFSHKNYMPINTLHSLMRQVVFPESVDVSQRFFIPMHRGFLLETMSLLPKEAGYSGEEYYDGLVKFFMYGDTKNSIPDHIEIYNKVGAAYGYLTDCAYIKDTKNNVEFILTATIHVNKNRTFNDNVYEYEQTGIPFLAELGRIVHEELVKKALK